MKISDLRRSMQLNAWQLVWILVGRGPEIQLTSDPRLEPEMMKAIAESKRTLELEEKAAAQEPRP